MERFFGFFKARTGRFPFTKETIAIIMMMFLTYNCAKAQFTATGMVISISGEPLIGVSVLIKNTTLGTVTDFDGTFSLKIPANNAILEFSYAGFGFHEEPVNQDNFDVTVVLYEDIARLAEVVVTGLATGVKRANSGNDLTTINADELVGITNPQTLDQALYGKIAGINIIANSGAPGGGVNLQLRGISTLGAGSSQPLFIVDGVYFDNSSIRTGRTLLNGSGPDQSTDTQDDVSNRIADLNPDDIERIEILKGPSAAAIFGTRANAGVVIITTKRGVQGKTRVSLKQDLGFAKGQHFVGFDTWDEAKIDAFFGGDADEKDALQRAQSEDLITDWEDFFYGETPLLSNTHLSISGGGQNTRFYLSGGVQSENGIIKNTGFDRYSMRVNTDHRLNDRIQVGLNAAFMKTDSDRGFTGNQNNTGGSIGYNIAYTPSYANLFPDENGLYPDNPYFNDNPIAIRDLSKNEQNVERLVMAGFAEIDLYQSLNTFLKLKLNGGIDMLSVNSLVYFPEILQHQRASANPGDVIWGRQDNLNSNFQGFLVLNTDLGAFNSNTAVGAVRLDQEAEFLLTRGRGLAGGQTNLEWAEVSSIQTQLNSSVTDLGLILQQDINWEDRVITSFGIRFDRSTLNRDQRKFYAFPKFSVAINLHHFRFFNINFIDTWKLRFAFGETGGLPGFSRTFESLSSQLIGGNLGGQVGTHGVDPTLKPETAAELEIGTDIGLFNGRANVELTYYSKRVNDLILDLTPAESTGILSIATNAADLENKGVELGIGLNIIRTRNFDWYFKMLYWHNDSKLVNLTIPTRTIGGFGPSLGTYLFAEQYSPTTIVGTPPGANFPGGFTVYGDRRPDFQMSFFNRISFLKNLSFNFLMHWHKGGKAINISALLWDDGGTSPDWDEDADDDGITNGMERIVELGKGNVGVYIEPINYLKLRELGLFYTFPRGFFSRVIENVTLGLSANNILLWTDYGGYDPEVSNFGSQPISSNIDVAPYPGSRRFFFHLKVDL